MTHWITVAEVSRRYSIPKGTIFYLVSTDQIPFYRVTKRNVRFDPDELDIHFRARKNVPYKQPKRATA